MFKDAFSDLDSTLECGTFGSLKALVQTLDELSEIVEEVGIEKLYMYLELILILLINFKVFSCQ